jgi:hypothetical protein
MYAEEFEIGPIHEHCVVACAKGDFEGILAQAAADRLGAYSRHMSVATVKECAEISRLFGALGSYTPYELQPGNTTGCEKCTDHNNHLFSTWFFGVAWDWCFVVIWEDSDLAWVGCLTDTD